jgi:hypothetical protein
VDFQTQNRDQVLASLAPATPTTPPAGEHTMTRRELRALREAEAAGAVSTDHAPFAVPSSAPSAAPEVPRPTFIAPAPEAPAPAAPETVAAPDAVVEQETLAEPEAIAEPETVSAAEPIALVTPPPLVAPTPQPSTRLDSALAEFDALAAGREQFIPAPDAPAPLPGRRAAQQPEEQATPTADPSQEHSLLTFESLFIAPAPALSQPTAPEAPAPQNATPETVATPEAVATPEPAPVAEPLPDPLLSAPAPQGAPALVVPPMGTPVAVPPAAASTTVEPPAAASPAAEVPDLAASNGPASGPTSIGHWSTQSDLDEAEQVTETTISRSVGAGSGAITTSALVLPAVPEPTITGPMSSNGEILLTGSISLPHSYSSTGAHPSRLDESDLDHLLDPGDHQVANTDSMPVRAIKAVSTHTATGTIIAPVKQPSTRGFTILIVAASAMAVVVVGLLVAGLVSGTL